MKDTRKVTFQQDPNEFLNSNKQPSEKIKNKNKNLFLTNKIKYKFWQHISKCQKETTFFGNNLEKRRHMSEPIFLHK